MILVIDNYDSFVYNLVQYLEELGKKTEVYRNDKISLRKIEEKKPEGIVISPGPGQPKNAGISEQVVEHFASQIPILGVCLGHQCIGEVFGAKIVRAKILMHGKTSLIYHYGKDIYQGTENPFLGYPLSLFNNQEWHSSRLFNQNCLDQERRNYGNKT